MNDPDGIAAELGRIAVEAGRLLAAVGDRRAGHQLKDDGSPSTDADVAAERLILSRLAALWPDIPVVAEESGSPAGRGERFFLVDPLDGTRDYLTGGSEYSVNIALVEADRPVAAALAAPGQDRVWVAGTGVRVARFEDLERGARGGRPLSREGGRWLPVAVRSAPSNGVVALASRRHGDAETDACLAKLRVGEVRTSSSAVKFGLIASAEADVYVRCGPTMEWDTAAGDHIVTVAGGRVFGPDGRPLTYGHNERGYLNGPFAAVGDPSLAPEITLPVR